MVQGMRASEAAHGSSLFETDGGTRAINPRLRMSGPAAPRQDAVGGAGKEACTSDQRLGAQRDIEFAEHVGPGAVQRMAALGPRVQLARQRSRRTSTSVPAAACSVAQARIVPGRGSLSGSPARLHVMQT